MTNKKVQVKMNKRETIKDQYTYEKDQAKHKV